MGASSADLCYYLRDAADSSAVRLRILEEDGTEIKTFRPDGEELGLEAGMHSFTWNMRYEDAESIEGMIMWAGSVRGPRAPPGSYRARLVVGADSVETGLEIGIDPRSESTAGDLRAPFDFLIRIRGKLSETHKAVQRIRAVRGQITDALDRFPEGDKGQIHQIASALSDSLFSVEEALYQTKNRSDQDPLNFPIRLGNKLASLAGTVATGDYRPTDQAAQVRLDLTRSIDVQLARLETLLATSLPALNAAMHEAAVSAIAVPDG